MSSQTKWIRIFQISETKTHKSYTVYKVTCTTFPIHCPEQANTVTTWKRFSQFQALYKSLSLVHKQLYLHGQFPEALETSYFNRKEPEVIESRRVWCLDLLEFIASQPILNTHTTFTNFLFDLQDHGVEGEVDQVPLGGVQEDDDQPGGVSGVDQEVRRDLSSPDLSGLQVVISANTLDQTPTLTPSPVMDSQQPVTESLESLVVTETSDEVPDYIKAAAENVSRALSAEAEDDIEQSLASYRAAIGGLLSNVQSDPDTGRQAQVKRRIAQYITKAEQLVKKEAEMKSRKVTKRPVGIPHLQLFGQLEELKQYKVKNIIASKIILAENIKTGDLVIFKTLHKSPAVYRKSKTSLLPINISYMVRLLKYFETEDCVYLLLEYCSVGLLWDIVKPLVKQTSSSQPPQSSQALVQCVKTPVKRQTSVIRPSQSFIQERKISFSRSQNCDETDSEEEDMMIVHQTSPNSVVVFDNENIQHIESYNSEEENIIENSQQMLDQISEQLGKNNAGVRNVLDKLDHLETKIKRHIEGDFSPEAETQALEEKVEIPPPSPAPPVADERPRVLRSLSEMLPGCAGLLETTDLGRLPDRLVRSWAAQLVQVLSSLHYREIIVRDLHPGNLLLDTTGHVKITYQCHWVSVDTNLSPAALAGNYCAPEVVGVGDITPAADWWSLGAILHLLYTGLGPSAMVGTGVDTSIPLHLSHHLPEEVTLFVSSLLQPEPENRLGAGSLGSHDVRQHQYFRGWDWDSMAWH